MRVNTLYNMDCRRGLQLMEEEDLKIDCIITSPPYWNLRKYESESLIWDSASKCNHQWDEMNFCVSCRAWKGELGLEPTFNLYIKHLCDIFDLAHQILKEKGSCWVNLGDTYSTQGGQNLSTNKDYSHYESIKLNNRMMGVPLVKYNELPSKCLCLIPFRFAIEMLNRGWILRNTIIWHKPNAMPSSARDRFTVDFEYLYFFVKKKKYYFKQQLEPYDNNLNRWGGDMVMHESAKHQEFIKMQKMGKNSILRPGTNMRPNPKGRNKRTTWSLNNMGCPEAHFAVFPPQLVETPIKAGCPSTGIVLDPFAGIGTTLKKAWELGRDFIGFELSKKYCKIARKKLNKCYNKRLSDFDKNKEGRI